MTLPLGVEPVDDYSVHRDHLNDARHAITFRSVNHQYVLTRNKLYVAW